MGELEVMGEVVRVVLVYCGDVELVDLVVWLMWLVVLVVWDAVCG
jgi:hypothetical protein